MNTQRKPVQYFQCTEFDIKSPSSWIEVTDSLVKSGKLTVMKEVILVKTEVKVHWKEGRYDRLTIMSGIQTPMDWSIRYHNGPIIVNLSKGHETAKLDSDTDWTTEELARVIARLDNREARTSLFEVVSNNFQITDGGCWGQEHFMGSKFNWARELQKGRQYDTQLS